MGASCCVCDLPPPRPSTLCERPTANAKLHAAGGSMPRGACPRRHALPHTNKHAVIAMLICVLAAGAAARDKTAPNAPRPKPPFPLDRLGRRCCAQHNTRARGREDEFRG